MLDLDDYEDHVDETPCDWQPRYFDACAVDYPTMSATTLDSPLYVIDTSADTLELFEVPDPENDPTTQTLVPVDKVEVGIVPQDDGSELAVLMFQALTIESTVVIRAWSQSDGKKRPLVLASWGPLEHRGTIDVSSNKDRDQALGAGGNYANCGAEDGKSVYALGGGGGGAFGGNGGPGGRVAGDANEGGKTAQMTPPSFVRGGCRGGSGLDTASMEAGAYGSGGGAVLLASNDEITVASGSLINAGGAGGQPATIPAGGGGGGSGGFIGLDAPVVTIQSDATVAANGGAGAGANHFSPSEARSGADGVDGDIEAMGGAGDDGADGGNGQSVKTDNESNVAYPGTEDESGSGGGGGSVGYVVYSAPLNIEVDPGAIVSPAEKELP